MANRMENTIVKTSFPTAITKEFLKILAVSGSISICLKLSRPTHLDFMKPNMG